MHELESIPENLSSRVKELKEQRLLRKALELERKELHSEVANVLSLVSFGEERSFLDDIIDSLIEGKFLRKREVEWIREILIVMAGESWAIQPQELRDEISEFQQLQYPDIKMILESWKTLYPIS